MKPSNTNTEPSNRPQGRRTCSKNASFHPRVAGDLDTGSNSIPDEAKPNLAAGQARPMAQVE
ncbi:hypothetical protein F2Q69_00048308 [Brassica cretica]|uniref:Uncharacterized protein n=1 Tax=Brassica cretica TaxID=69181 RepID=A0A8S9PI46_BRACR|nr:hypothetical protein F2Q69_00048308 [Brassica cretica]